MLGERFLKNIPDKKKKTTFLYSVFCHFISLSYERAKLPCFTRYLYFTLLIKCFFILLFEITFILEWELADRLFQTTLQFLKGVDHEFFVYLSIFPQIFLKCEVWGGRSGLENKYDREGSCLLKICEKLHFPILNWSLLILSIEICLNLTWFSLYFSFNHIHTHLQSQTYQKQGDIYHPCVIISLKQQHKQVHNRQERDPHTVHLFVFLCRECVNCEAQKQK